MISFVVKKIGVKSAMNTQHETGSPQDPFIFEKNVAVPTDDGSLVM